MEASKTRTSKSQCSLNPVDDPSFSLIFHRFPLCYLGHFPPVTIPCLLRDGFGQRPFSGNGVLEPWMSGGLGIRGQKSRMIQVRWISNIFKYSIHILSICIYIIIYIFTCDIKYGMDNIWILYMNMII